MRVNKNQITHGIADYIQSDILPKMANDRAMQIILSIAANTALTNNKLVDTVLNQDIVQALLEDDGTGTYDVGKVADSMRSAIEMYGSFPVTIPAIPLLSPREITLNLDAADVESMRRHIENAV